jgi:hypothetical protein
MRVLLQILLMRLCITRYKYKEGERGEQTIKLQRSSSLFCFVLTFTCCDPHVEDILKQNRLLIVCIWMVCSPSPPSVNGGDTQFEYKQR